MISVNVFPSSGIGGIVETNSLQGRLGTFMENTQKVTWLRYYRIYNYMKIKNTEVSEYVKYS